MIEKCCYSIFPISRTIPVNEARKPHGGRGPHLSDMQWAKRHDKMLRGGCPVLPSEMRFMVRINPQRATREVAGR
jgi:predicted nuclease with RNAse H fold